MLGFMQKIIVGILLSPAFALVGRWIQLHPEKIVPTGRFMGPDSIGARLFRVLVAVIGTIAVFGGACGVFLGLLLFVFTDVPAVDWMMRLAIKWMVRLAIVAVGTATAVYVRREAKARPLHKSNGPTGRWP
jgi:hypothetical protein